jgi:hypothetical protein
MSSFKNSDVQIDNLPVPVTVVSEYVNPVNVFGEVDVPYATETTIVSYTVPLTKTLDLTSIVGWGDYVGEFFVRVDGVQRGGGWTTAAQITLVLPFEDAPIIATPGQVVTVSVVHYKTATRHFKANICGGTN